MSSPLPTTDGTQRPGSRAHATWCIALLLAASVAAFARLGREEVVKLNEAREGVYARAMIDTGNWILPQVPNHVENGEMVPDKPPLFHWISAGVTWLRAIMSGRSLGGRHAVAQSFDAWSLRTPSAIAGCLTVLGILWLGARLVGKRAALLAGACLVTSWQFVNQARYGRVDMCLACFTTWAMLLSGITFLLGHRSALVGAAAAAGLAVLSKGPLGILLPLVALCGWAVGGTLAHRPARRLLDAPWLAAAVVFLGVVLPWYLAAWRLGGQAFLHSQLQSENLDQFVGKNGRMEAFYYLGPWLSDSWPWNLLALLAAIEAFRSKEPASMFCATSWLAFLAFFQASAYKRGAYLLPALPIGALLAGRQLDRWLERKDRVRDPVGSTMFGGWVAASAIAGVAGAVAAVLFRPEASIAALVGHPVATGDVALVFGSLAGALSALCASAGAFLRGAPRTCLSAAFTAAFVLHLGVFTTALGAQSEWISPRPLVARIEELTPANKSVVVEGVGDDPSLLLLYHARDPARFDVIPARDHRRRRPAGEYHLSESEWDRIQAKAPGCAGAWKELFRGPLYEGGGPVSLVLARREREDPREIP